MSCGAACVRQILLDAGIDVAESTIRELAGYDEELGTFAEGLVGALDRLQPSVRYRQQAVLPEELDALAQRVPFIALLRMPSRHFVIVDRVDLAEVHLRDPAGTGEDTSVGASGVMDRKEFLDRWKRAINGAIYRG